jgi:hypothetical protein
VAVACCLGLLAHAPLAFAAEGHEPFRSGRDEMVAVALDEIAHVETQVKLPQFYIVTNNPWTWDMSTSISPYPTKYTITIIVYRFWQESIVKREIVHELGHVMLNEYGVPQSEEMADAFSDCYSTVGKHGAACDKWQEYVLTTARK